MAITMTATGGDRNKMRKCSKPRAAASDLVFVVCLVGLLVSPLGLKGLKGLGNWPLFLVLCL